MKIRGQGIMRALRVCYVRAMPHLRSIGSLIAALPSPTAFYVRAVTFLRSKIRRDGAFIGVSFFLGAVICVILLDMAIMPLYLFLGHETTVPEFRGKTWMEAHTMARKSQVFIVQNGTEYHDAIPARRIVTQRPAAGTRVKPGRRVLVVISLGPESVVVPNVVGKTLLDAELCLRGAGLTVGEKRVRTSRQFRPGTIMRQYPKAGTRVRAGAEIGLHVAREHASESQP